MFKTKKNLIILILLFLLTPNIVGAQPFNLFKFHDDNTLDLVQISDVHFADKTKGSSKRMLEHSGALLKDAVSQINNLSGEKLVVFSGDVINNSNKNDFLKFFNIANGLKSHWYYAPGNHDVGILGGVSKSDIINLLDKNSQCFNCNESQAYCPALRNNPLYYACYPNKNFMILFMDGVIDDAITANGYFPKEELIWLNTQLKNNPAKKVIIVQHFPVVEPIKSITHKVRNADEYLEIIDKYSNVIAVLSGHYHAAKITQRKNVLHISTPALIEYPNAFREIKITKLNDGTKFEIRLIETNLKDVQKTSLSRSKNSTSEKDTVSKKNTVIIIKNPK